MFRFFNPVGSIDIVMTCPKCGYTGHGTQTYDGMRTYQFFSGSNKGECPSCASKKGCGEI